MHIIDEQVANLRAGERISVHTDDYQTAGLFIGLTIDPDGPQLRLLGDDRLERRVPLPAEVRVLVGANVGN